MTDKKEGRCTDLDGQCNGLQPAFDDTTGAGDLLPVTLDTKHYPVKPRGAEIGAITKRMQTRGSIYVTRAELCAHLEAGGTIVCGCYMPSPEGWGAFVGQRVFALDFDDGLITADEATRRALGLGLDVIAVHPTFSHTDDTPRFRVVIDGGETIECEGEAEIVISWLLMNFPEADQRCRNCNRLFFGSPGELYPMSAD